jgi:DNA-binding NarL/FixJ family response regulator
MAFSTSRIIIIDDHPAIIRNLSLLLEISKHIKIVGKYEDGKEAIKNIKTDKPDVILVDIHMPKLDGFEVSRQLLELDSNLKIIGISMDNSPQNAYTLLSIGALGFVTKTSPTQELLAAIEAVMNGKTYICAETRALM